ncbi:MAG: choice-of-anchor A family protein [Phenylobacterium sp.]|uniref:collagen-binding domain-containing protein n=1 Tax=Phenylobacterium sp. TaxID=1871053 RepID=UPI001A4BE72E|nr:collagen-binding domain-containing protein [Phenylobacterium sp.]MBL8554728.1 choice-of-anchor A family protein [Phenylobacterium sp.]
MRLARSLSALFAAGLVLAGAGMAAAAPAPAADNAAQINAGLQAMRDYNLIALKDLQSSQGVQGRTFVGGNLTGGSSNYMTRSGQSGGVALTVAGSVTGGAKNVSNGGAVVVGGNLDSGANMNGGGSVTAGGNVKKVNANGATVTAGGDVAQTNARTVYAGGKIDGTNATDLYAGGAISKNSNGVRHTGYPSQVGGLSAQLEQQALDYAAELEATSEYLSGLQATNLVETPDKWNAVFNPGAGTGVAVYTIADLPALLQGRSNLKFNTPSGYDAVIVNVAGTNISLPGSINFNNGQGLGASVIWNFYEATSINLNSKSWFGSILAPNAELKFGNSIEGSVVARSLIQNGEIRLGGFSGGLSIAQPVHDLRAGIPEPATWAMMILGFGAVGAMVRRRRAATALA